MQKSDARDFQGKINQLGKLGLGLRKADKIISQALSQNSISWAEIARILPLRVIEDERRTARVLDILTSLLENIGVPIVSDEKEDKHKFQEQAKPKKIRKDRSRITSEEDDRKFVLPGADLLYLYFKEAKRFKLLEPEEEQLLAKEIKESNGNPEPRNKLVVHNLRLSASIARRYQGRGLDYLDLIQEGNIGLIEAAEKFDGQKGFRFSTYAVWWVRQKVIRALQNHSRTIRIPIHIQTEWEQILQASAELARELKREPTIEEVAKAVNLKVERVEKILRFMRMLIVYLYDTADNNKGDGDGYLIKTIPNENLTPEQIVIAKDALKKEIKEVRSALSELWRIKEEYARLFKMRFGLDGSGEPETLAKVGKSACKPLTRERVRQIVELVFRKLKKVGVDIGEEWLTEKLDRIAALQDIVGGTWKLGNNALFIKDERPTPEKIIEAVADVYKVSVINILMCHSEEKYQRVEKSLVKKALQAAIYLFWVDLGITMKETASYFEMRPATVHCYRHNMLIAMENDYVVRGKIAAIREKYQPPT